jgi:hypothetical protein
LLLSNCATPPETVDTGEIGSLNVLVAPQSTTGCIPSENKSHSFPEGVDRFEIRLSGQISFASSIVEEDLNDDGEALIVGIPPADNLTLDLYGCQGTQLQFSGRTLGVNIVKNDKVAPALYFTKKSTFNCTGSATKSNQWSADLPKATAFHRSVITPDGDVLLVGGFSLYFFPPKLIAGGGGADIYLYRPAIGLFRAWTDTLRAPRGWHHLVSFDEGRKILVVGGAREAALKGTNDPPIFATGLPEAAVEIIDLWAGTSTTSNLNFDAHPMAAVAQSPSGKFIVSSGGMGTDGKASTRIQILNAAADELVGGTAQTGTGNLQLARVGHTATYLGKEQVLVLGGNLSGGPEKMAEVISLQEPGGTVLSSEVLFDQTLNEMPVLTLHESALLSSIGDQHLLLVVGGAGIIGNPDGTAAFTPPSALGPQLYVVEISGTPANYSGRIAGKTGFEAGRLERAFHSLTALDEQTFMIGGGYGSFGAPSPTRTICYDGVPKTGCYLADTLIIKVTGTNVDDAVIQEHPLNSGLTFNTARFGHNVIVLPDGTALSSGGLQELAAQGADPGLLDSAEILNPMREADTDICAKTAPQEEPDNRN